MRFNFRHEKQLDRDLFYPDNRAAEELLTVMNRASLRKDQLCYLISNHWDISVKPSNWYFVESESECPSV